MSMLDRKEKLDIGKEQLLYRFDGALWFEQQACGTLEDGKSCIVVATCCVGCSGRGVVVGV